MAVSVVCGLFLLLPHHLADGGRATPLHRVFYVSYVDDESDDKGQLNYRRFTHALNALGRDVNQKLSVEFVQVVVGRAPSIQEALRYLVHAQPIAIIATSDDVLQAAKAATDSIPILFMSYADPVATGEVHSFAAPGVNRTGFTFHVPSVEKATELLVDAYPPTRRIGIVVDSPTSRRSDFQQETQRARRRFGLEITVLVADNRFELDQRLRAPSSRRIDAWYVPRGAALWYDRAAVIAMMSSTRRPVLYDHVAFVREGGLMAYEARISDPFRIWANQLLMIAQGTDVATIPVEKPSEFALAVNLDALRRDPKLRPSKDVLRWATVLVGNPAREQASGMP